MINTIIDKFFSLIYLHDKQGHVAVYSSDSILIKERHIPLMAYRLLEGEVEVYKEDRLIGKFAAHTCWGMNEIMNEKPSQYTVVIKRGSKVCTVGKSELHKTWMKILHLFESDMLEVISKTPDFNH